MLVKQRGNLTWDSKGRSHGEFAARLEALSHGAMFLATCNAILLMGDVKLANTCFRHSLLVYIFNIPNICHKFTSLEIRIALHVARKIAPCDRAFTELKLFPDYMCSFSRASYDFNTNRDKISAQMQ